MNKFSLGGLMVGEKGLDMLRAMALKPLDIATCDGFAKRTLLALAKKGLATADAKQAVLTAKATALLNGTEDRPATTGKRKARRVKPAPPARSNGHGAVDIAELRQQIVARYEADLAALDRIAEIARAVNA